MSTYSYTIILPDADYAHLREVLAERVARAKAELPDGDYRIKNLEQLQERVSSAQLHAEAPDPQGATE